MANNDRISDFVKSGPRRLLDAEELMETPTHHGQGSDARQRHLRTAMYLAGYAVECLLKAYLIEQENSQSLAEAQGKINRRRRRQGVEEIPDIAHTAAGHNISRLVSLTDLAERPGYDPKLWGRLSQWQTAWRYAHDFPERAKAEAFMNDVRVATNWLTPKIVRG
jgi:hypothetical protein